MTTTTETRTTARPYPLENLWRKGAWVARVTGPHPKYVFDRTFCRGVPNRRRGTLEYQPGHLEGPGWVVTNDGYGRHLIEARDLDYIDHGEDVTSVEILLIHQAGPPGARGAWNGQRCPEDARPLIGGVCAQCAESEPARAHAATTADLEEPF